MHTSDICDSSAEAQVLMLPTRAYGRRRQFHGPIRTVKVFEDNALVRKALEGIGGGAVLVVDGGGSMRRALLGDRLAALGAENGWAGVLVYGAIRDADTIATIDLGVRALGTCPRKTEKRGEGQVDVELQFGGVTFRPGAYLYADADGVVVLENPVP